MNCSPYSRSPTRSATRSPTSWLEADQARSDEILPDEVPAEEEQSVEEQAVEEPPTPAKTSEPAAYEADPTGWTPFQFAFFSPIQIFAEEKDVRGVRISFPFGSNADMDGLDVGGIGVSASMTGLQINMAYSGSDNLDGVQIGALNQVMNRVRGLQLSGVLNEAEEVSGVQITGIHNRAESVAGLQIAGMVNALPLNDPSSSRAPGTVTA